MELGREVENSWNNTGVGPTGVLALDGNLEW